MSIGASNSNIFYTAAEKEESRKRSIAQNNMMQNNHQEIALHLIEKLKSYIRSFGEKVIYDEYNFAVLPLPWHLANSEIMIDDDDYNDESEQIDNLQPSYKQFESINTEQKFAIDPQYQNYQVPLKSKEVSICLYKILCIF
jgi:hypothetical protein